MNQPLRAQLTEVLLHGTERDFPHLHLHLCVDLRRTFSQGELEAAAVEVIRAFPVLGCRFRAGWWRDRWLVWDGDLAELVHREQVAPAGLEEATRVQVRRRFDHTVAPAWRLAALEHEGGSRLLISLHHMTGDGGGLKALGSVVAASLCGVDPSPRPTDSRSMLAPARGLGLRDLPILALEFLREGLQPLSLLRVRRLRRTFARGGGEPEPSWRTVALRGEAARAFLASCREQRATINDGLVAAVSRLSARRGERGPVAAGYTIDLRRYLPPALRVTNLHGVSLVVLPRSRVGDPATTLQAVSDRIGEQKRRLPGLAYTLLPLVVIGWLPHGLLRRAGRVVLNNVLSSINRALAITNIGALDETLAPLGEEVEAASVIGPFVHGLPVPLVTATGFRRELTLHVEATGTLAEQALDDYAEELREVLER